MKQPNTNLPRRFTPTPSRAEPGTSGDHLSETEQASAARPESRRLFFKAALCAPALAVAATAATAAQAAGTPAAAVSEDVPPKQSNYHETPHIRTYYDLAAY